MTPGTECPAEMNFYFPAHRALCMAENATHNLHNLLTLRGAQVRDPRIWSRYLDEAIELFADDTDVSFASHHWPTWGTDAIVTYLDRAARPVRLPARPDAAADQPGLHPQRDRRDDRDAARARGGVAHPRLLRLGQPQRQGDLPALPRLVRRQPGAPVAAPARRRPAPATSRPSAASTPPSPRPGSSSSDGDLRFAAELASHAVFAAPDHAAAREVLAGGARAARLRRRERDVAQQPTSPAPASCAPAPIEHTEVNSAGLAPALTVTQLFDSVAIRIDGPKAWDERLTRSRWHFTDARRALPHGAQQRRPHPPPHTRRRAGRRRP